MTRINAKIRSGGMKEHLIDKIKILKNDGDNFYELTLKDHFAHDILFVQYTQEYTLHLKEVIIVVLTVPRRLKVTF